MASVEGGILRSGQGSVRNGERGGRGYCEAGSEVASGGGWVLRVWRRGERGRGEYDRTHIGQRQDNIHGDMMR